MNQYWEDPVVNVYTRKDFGLYDTTWTWPDTGAKIYAHYFKTFELVQSFMNIKSIIFRQDLYDLSYLEVQVPVYENALKIRPLDIVCINCEFSDYEFWGMVNTENSNFYKYREQMIITRIEQHDSLQDGQYLTLIGRSLKWIMQGKIISNFVRTNCCYFNDHSTMSTWNYLNGMTTASRDSVNTDWGAEFSLIDNPAGGVWMRAFTNRGTHLTRQNDSDVAYELYSDNMVGSATRDDFGRSYADMFDEMLAGTSFFYRTMITGTNDQKYINNLIVKKYDSGLTFDVYNATLSETAYVEDITDYFNSCMTMTDETNVWYRKYEWFDQKYTDSLVDDDKLAPTTTPDNYIDEFKQRHMCSSTRIQAKNSEGKYCDMYESNTPLYPTIFENGRQECSDKKQQNSLEATIQPYNKQYLKDFFLGDIITIKDRFGNVNKALITQVEETWQQNEGYRINLTTSSMYLNGEYVGRG